MRMLTDCLSQNIKLKYGRMNLAVKQFNLEDSLCLFLYFLKFKCQHVVQ